MQFVFFDVSTISAVACQSPGTHIHLVETAVEIAPIRRREFRFVFAKLGHIHTEILSKEFSPSFGSQLKVSFLLVPLNFHFFALVLF